MEDLNLECHGYNRRCQLVELQDSRWLVITLNLSYDKKQSSGVETQKKKKKKVILHIFILLHSFFFLIKINSFNPNHTWFFFFLRKD